MTAYELMEVRANSLDRADRLFALWVTTTFALIAAAYVTGHNLGWVASIGIAALYAFVCVGNAVATRSEVGVVLAATKDLSSAMPSENISQTISGDLARGQSLNSAGVAVQALGSIGALTYLFFRVAGGG